MIKYQFSDIVTATRNFHTENLIGQGGFGKVYRGNIRSTVFAIKVLNKVSYRSTDVFFNVNLRCNEIN